MTYNVRDLHGAWVNLDDDSLLKLGEGGDFKLTSADDNPVTVGRWINVEREIVYGEITHLTGTDLWIENPQGEVTKFQKKYRAGLRAAGQCLVLGVGAAPGPDCA